LRRRETVRLFQAAAAKLHEWREELGECHVLVRGGGVRAWNELYAAR
jgi:hypothetical protein